MNSTHHFELYVMSDRITSSQWDKLYQAIVKQGGLLGAFELMFACTDNVVRFFVSSPHNVSALSNGIEGMVLRQTEKPGEPTTIKRERFIALPTTNILDMREYYLISKHKTLEYVTVKVGPLGLTKTQLFFRDQNNQWSVAVKYTKHFAAHLFAIDFAANTAYLKKQPPLYLDIEKSLSMLTGDPAGALFCGYLPLLCAVLLPESCRLRVR